MLSAADKRLTEVRKGDPGRGRLVIATDQESARAYAKILKKVTGESATVVLSDEKAASKKIDKFSEDDSRWMVAVRMVSEGVDVPRLAVGGCTPPPSRPPLFFAQAVGRFVRSRRRGETASVFVPTIPMLLDFANEMEVERDHVLDKPKKGSDEENPFAEEDKLLADAEKLEDEETEEQLPFEALESDAVFDRVLYDGAEFGMQAHPPAARRSRTTSASRGSSNPTRCSCCSRSGRPGRSRTAGRSPPRTPTCWRNRPRTGRSSPTSSCSACASS